MVSFEYTVQSEEIWKCHSEKKLNATSVSCAHKFQSRGLLLYANYFVLLYYVLNYSTTKCLSWRLNEINCRAQTTSNTMQSEANGLYISHTVTYMPEPIIKRVLSITPVTLVLEKHLTHVTVNLFMFQLSTPKS